MLHEFQWHHIVDMCNIWGIVVPDSRFRFLDSCTRNRRLGTGTEELAQSDALDRIYQAWSHSLEKPKWDNKVLDSLLAQRTRL
jgi:hypothetical protein